MGSFRKNEGQKDGSVENASPVVEEPSVSSPP
jgi:hypothetical protein